MHQKGTVWSATISKMSIMVICNVIHRNQTITSDGSRSNAHSRAGNLHRRIRERRHYSPRCQSPLLRDQSCSAHGHEQALCTSLGTRPSCQRRDVSNITMHFRYWLNSPILQSPDILFARPRATHTVDRSPHCTRALIYPYDADVHGFLLSSP